MSSSPSEQFFTLIKKGCVQLSQLSELLDAERQALQDQSLDDLKTTVDEKRVLLEQIATNISARNDLLKAQNFSVDDTGLNAFLDSLPDRQRQMLRKQWDELAAQLKNTNELNQRNEKIIKRSQQSMSQVLAIMQGHSAKTTLYDQKGGKGNYSPHNSLGKA